MIWSEQSFIAYLKAVDDTLEAFYGTASDQDELEFIAEAHQQNSPPDTAALCCSIGRRDRGKNTQ